MSPYLGGAILIGFVAWTAGVGYEGFKYGEDKTEAADASALVAEQLQHKKDQAAADAEATAFEVQRTKLEQQADTLEKQMEDSYAKVVDDCIVPDNLVRLRNKAAGQ